MISLFACYTLIVQVPRVFSNKHIVESFIGCSKCFFFFDGLLFLAPSYEKNEKKDVMCR